MITPALDLQAAPQLIDGLKAQSATTDAARDAGGFGAAFAASLSATPAPAASTDGGAHLVPKQVPSSTQGSDATAVRAHRGADKPVSASANGKQSGQNLALALSAKVTGVDSIAVDRESKSAGTGRSRTAPSLPVVEAPSTDAATLSPRLAAEDNPAQATSRSNTAKGVSEGVAVVTPGASRAVVIETAQSGNNSTTSASKSEAVGKTSTHVAKSKPAMQVEVQTASFDATQTPPTTVMTTPERTIRIPNATSLPQSHASTTSIAEAAAPAVARVVLPTQTSVPTSVAPVQHAASPASVPRPGDGRSQAVAAWNSVEQGALSSAPGVSRTSSTPTGERFEAPDTEHAEAKITRQDPEEDVSASSRASAGAAESSLHPLSELQAHASVIAVPIVFTITGEPGADASTSRLAQVPERKWQIPPTVSTATQATSIVTPNPTVSGALQSTTQGALGVADPSSTSAKSTAQSGIATGHLASPTSQVRGVSAGNLSTVAHASSSASASELRYAIGAVSDGPSPIRETHEGLRSAPILPVALTKTVAADSLTSGQSASVAAQARTSEHGPAATTSRSSQVLGSGVSGQSADDAATSDSSTTTSVAHAVSAATVASNVVAHGVPIVTAEMAGLPASVTVPVSVASHEPASLAAVGAQAAIGNPVSSALQGVATESVHGTGALTAAVSSQPHQTLAATPTSLEVGVHSGSQGWVKIRAEVGDQGDVKASLEATSPGGEQILKGQLPALNAYLHNQQVPVTATVAERVGSGHGAATHDASLGSASTSTGSNGQDASLLQRGGDLSSFGQGGRQPSEPSSPAPSVTHQRGDDVVQRYLGRSGAADASLPQTGPDGSGRWLNVTV